MRSTKIAPDALSTSYLTGSASLGISMMTLISSGGFLPVGTRSRPMSCSNCVRPRRTAGGGFRECGPAFYVDVCCGAAVGAGRPASRAAAGPGGRRSDFRACPARLGRFTLVASDERREAGMRQLIAMLLAGLVFGAQAQPVAPAPDHEWDPGAADCTAAAPPPLQVRRLDARTFVLRQNPCASFEANFLYLLV